MKVLAVLGLSACLAAPARAGGVVAPARATPSGGVVKAVLPQLGLGGASFKLGGRSLADWGLKTLLPVVVPGVHLNFAPQTQSFETPAAHAEAGAYHAEAMAETLAAPQLLVPGAELILDPGAGTPPNAARGRSFAVKSAAIRGEIQRVGPVGGWTPESADSLGRRVADLMSDAGSLEAAGSGLKPAQGLPQGAGGSGAQGGWSGGETLHGGGQTLASGRSGGKAGTGKSEGPPPPPDSFIVAALAEEGVAGSVGGWTLAARELPAKVTRIAMRAFQLGLSFTPRLKTGSAAVVAETVKNDVTVPFVPASKKTASSHATVPISETAFGLSEKPAVSFQQPPTAPEGETFSFLQTRGERSSSRTQTQEPSRRLDSKRRAPMLPDQAAKLLLASLVPLLGLTFLAGYRLN